MSSIPSQPRLAEVATTGPLAELLLAEDVQEVIAITRAHLETCTTREILRLPFYCRPGRITDAKQIRELAFLLEHAQAHFSGRLIDAMVLDRMAAFFSAASRARDRASE